MHKRKLVPKMLAAAAPALLPLSASAQPADGRNMPLPPTAQTARQGMTLRSTQQTAGAVRAINTAANAQGSAHLSGQVTLPEGSEAARATLYFSWMQNDGKQKYHKAVCDGTGKFDVMFPLPTGNGQNPNVVNVSALLPGHGLAWTQVTIADQHIGNLKLRLLPGTTLEGHLVRADGAPAANTEVYLQTLLPQAFHHNGVTNSDPQPGSKASHSNVTQQAQQQAANFARIMPLLPPEGIATLCRATTNAEGKFILNDVPRTTSVTLGIGGKMALAAGSANGLTIQDKARQQVGVFVMSSTGRLKARVLDAATGKPMPQMYVGVSAADPALNMALIRQLQFHPEVMNRLTDANGEFTSPDLLPGEYNVNVQGCTKRVRVEAGHDTPLVQVTLRQGLLKGRLIDANGKPVPNAEVRLASAQNNSASFTRFRGGFNVFSSGMQVNNGVVFANNVAFAGGGNFSFALNNLALVNPDDSSVFFNTTQAMMTVRTDAEGRFVMPNMPWGSPAVRIWTTQGNDLAEWSGPAGKIDETLTLKMRPNALVSVSGRLVDPQRHPLINAQCQALHWLPSPRITWFATARPVQTDKDGNFHIDGLERGESFSLITVAGQQRNLGPEFRVDVSNVTVLNSGASANLLGQAVAARPQAIDGLARQIQAVDVHDFESPRFTTCARGDGQPLGEVMVHPQDTPDEVMQSYGGDSFGDSNPLPGVVATPNPADIRMAQQTLARFEAALQTGDVETLHQLTSRVSPGWSANKQEFLGHAGLCGRLDMEGDAQNAQALRFVPRRAVATLMQMAPKAAQADRAETESGTDALNGAANWAFLAKPQGEQIALAGVLHREAGQWRVVVNPTFATANAIQMVNSGAGQIATARWGQAAAPLAADTQQAVQQVGEKYLQTWLAGDKATLRGQTSPFSPLFGNSVEQFRHRLEKRADDGACPLASGEKVMLEPVETMTLWEQEWLKHAAGLTARFAGQQREMEVLTEIDSRVPTAQSATEAGNAPDKAAPGADMAAFHYTAQGRSFLMVLLRRNARWQMLEPALPL